MNIFLEIWVANLAYDRINYVFGLIDVTEKNVDPDLEIEEYVKAKINPDSTIFLIHSTSWRYVNGDIYLTYLVYSDKFDPLTRNNFQSLMFADVVTEFETPNKNVGGKDFSPNRILSHAMRHLAFLLIYGSDERFDKFISK